MYKGSLQAAFGLGLDVCYINNKQKSCIIMEWSPTNNSDNNSDCVILFTLFCCHCVYLVILSSVKDDGARLDVAADGFWGDQREQNLLMFIFLTR